MPTELVLLMVFFGGSFAVFALVMLIDAKTIVVRPPNLSVAEGRAEASSTEVEATHEEDKASGSLRVRAAVHGAGRARVAAQLGHEFEIRAKRPGRYHITAVYEHMTEFRIVSGSARLNVLMHLNIKDKSMPIGELTYTDIGNRRVPPSGGYTVVTKKQMVALKADAPCRVSIGVTATAEQAGGVERVNCHVEAVTKLKELQLRPALGNFFS